MTIHDTTTSRPHLPAPRSHARALATALALAAATGALGLAGGCVAEPCPEPSDKVETPKIYFTAPTIQCAEDMGMSIIDFSSDNGQPSYQPGADQCVAITDPSGQLVAPYLVPEPYLVKQFTSQPLALTPGTAYTVEIVVCSTGQHAYPGGDSSFPYSNATLIAPDCGADVARGMTWGEYAVNDPITGVVQVGCQPGGAAPFDCNAYDGDTPCTSELPVLCKLALDLPQPASFTTPPDDLHVWSGNVVATTPPVSPATAGLTTLAAVNAYCEAQFGAGWEVAEFHDGWGWNFTAYGDVGTQTARFWVDINDQPGATCW